MLRVVEDLYTERQVWGQHDRVKGMSFAVFVYAQARMKHVQPKVADDKFELIVSSALKHSQHPRVRTFCRFLGLLSPLSSADLDYYLSAYNQLKEYCTDAAEGAAAIPLPATMSVAKSMFEGQVPQKHFDAFYRGLAALDLRKATQLTPLEPVLHLFRRMQRDAANFTSSFVVRLFDCMDVSGTQLHTFGSIELADFEMLCRHLSAKQLSEAEVREVFDTYADIGADCLAMSFYNFRELTTALQLFTKPAYDSFLAPQQPLRQYVELHAAEMKWQLKQLQDTRGHALQRYYQSVLERLDTCEPETLWLALQLAEVEVKEALAELKAQQLTPFSAATSEACTLS